MVNKKFPLHYIYSFFIMWLLGQSSALAQSTELKYLTGVDKDHTVLWDFMVTKGKNAGNWTKINVPSNWEFEGFGNFSYGNEKEDPEEAGLYRHSFTLPGQWKNKEVFIVFDGAMTDTEVKINGRLAGPVHQGAFYRFKYNITKLLKPGQSNLLEVKVNKVSSNQSVNEAERGADYWVFGGLFRPVFLEATPKEHLSHVSIDARADGAIRINASVTNLKTPATVVAQLKDKSGKPFGEIFKANYSPGDSVVQLSSKFDHPNLWSPEFPNLYHIDIQLKRGATVLHSLKEKIGFRTVELKKHDGFYVNGVKVRFKGVNRGAFWPSTGRTTSKKISIDDVNLIKDMNMNAVRMSHYPPDKHFLEVCDSLGLFVIDELSGWQYPPYDSQIGKKLVRELINRDVNHPSIVLWANGNEGGFNFDLLPEYSLLDIQKRPVIQPWMNINNMNTKHYIPWNYGINTFFQGNDVFFPTEFLHGLYDGGHGAGLDDFWNLMLSKPLSAGGFLWDFSDQAVVRKDKENLLDTKGNSGADGILGPYREKEASFYTIKEIWSPIFFENKIITEQFEGVLNMENRYHYTNLNQCNFSYQLKKINSFEAADTSVVTGKIKAPNISPQQKGKLHVSLPVNWREYDVLSISATDVHGRGIYTWTWAVTTPNNMTEKFVRKTGAKISVNENDDMLMITANNTEIKLDKKTGLLSEVISGKKKISFQDGPTLINGSLKLKSFKHNDIEGTHIVDVVYEGDMRFKVQWKIYPSGWISMAYEYRPKNHEEMIGINFQYPEEFIVGMQLIGDGPYRVYKNRLKGVTFNTWEKKYNDAVTGEVWEYPEFKGYYGNFYGAKIKTKEGDFTVLTKTEGLFLHMFNPRAPQYVKNTHSMANYPLSNGISFLHGISAIGTKSQPTEDLGPQSEKNLTFANGGLDMMKGELYFDFSQH